MPTDFALPSLGENVAGGDVLKVLVKAGDVVARDQPVLELETDKATIEVPSGVSGTVAEVRVKEGEKIKVGQIVFTFEGEAAAAPPAAAAPKADPAIVTPVDDDALDGEGDAGSEVEAVTPPPPPGAAHGAGKDPWLAAPGSSTPTSVEFVLPSLGENVGGGDILHVMVKVGDTVSKDQPVLELETDKATIEVPSSVAGTVTEVRVKEGEKAAVGQVVFVVETSAGDTAQASPVKYQAVKSTSPSPAVTADEGMHQHVGGVIKTPVADKPGMLEHALEEAAADGAPRAVLPPRADVVEMGRGRDAKRPPAPASPSVRRAARELGADIYQVKGTGPGGRISIDDVKSYVKSVMSGGGPKAAVAAGPGVVQTPLPDFSKFGAIERKPMRGVRRKTAEHLSNAWSQIPHVTQCDLADVTALEELRKQFGKRAEAAGGKLTVTAVTLKVIAAALKQFPQFNAAVDMAADEIVFKKYVNVGVAVDTERGLLVPVIRDVDRKNIIELSAELQQVSERARTGKTSLDEMQGGCFTITNLGGIGGTYFTPIVNLPEVAILGMSRATMQPVWKDGEFVPRLMLPLSLSYDHRVIDGADGIRFLRFVCEALEQPFLLSLAG